MVKKINRSRQKPVSKYLVLPHQFLKVPSDAHFASSARYKPLLTLSAGKKKDKSCKRFSRVGTASGAFATAALASEQLLQLQITTAKIPIRKQTIQLHHHHQARVKNVEARYTIKDCNKWWEKQRFHSEDTKAMWEKERQYDCNRYYQSNIKVCEHLQRSRKLQTFIFVVALVGLKWATEFGDRYVAGGAGSGWANWGPPDKNPEAGSGGGARGAGL
eukprot:g10110.t1